MNRVEENEMLEINSLVNRAYSIKSMHTQNSELLHALSSRRRRHEEILRND